MPGCPTCTPPSPSDWRRLAPDQRAAATAPPGPVLCVAPAGSGKTTTLVARVAWLVDGGADPGSVCLVAFNKRAAEELTERLDAAVAPLGVPAGSVRVRTFHALGREILRDAGVPVEPLADRDEVLRELAPDLSRADRGRLDLAFSRLKLDLRVTAAEVASDPARRVPSRGRSWRTRRRWRPAAGSTSTTSWSARSSGSTTTRRCSPGGAGGPPACSSTRRRTSTGRSSSWRCSSPRRPTTCSSSGDDDQTIYSWRLADVRRVLGLAASLPGLRRVDLETNYRCPPPVVARAVRLVEHNRERFAKRILAGSRSGGRILLAPDGADDAIRVRRAMAAWPPDGSTRAVLARTNRELLTAVVAALDLGIPFRAPDLALVLEDARLDGLLDRACEAAARHGWHGSPLPVLGALRSALLAEAAARRATHEPATDEPSPPTW